MSHSPLTPPLEGALVQSVTLVDRLSRTVPGTFRVGSLPGHLLHLVVAGEVTQEVNGHTQRLTPGTAVWYYEDEVVTGHILRVPWTFYTVNFQALRLLPPPGSQRVARRSAGHVLFRGTARGRATRASCRWCATCGFSRG